MARVATCIVAGLIGAVYGVAGTIMHATTWGVFPIALIIAFIGLVALLIALRQITGDRWAALTAAAAAVLATFILSLRGPGGSVLLPAPSEGEISLGLLWSYGVPLVAALVVAWPSMSGIRPAREQLDSNA